MSNACAISTSSNYHWVTKVRAVSNIKGCLKIIICGDPEALDYQLNEAEINIFMEDASKVDALVAAINGALVRKAETV